MVEHNNQEHTDMEKGERCVLVVGTAQSVEQLCNVLEKARVGYEVVGALVLNHESGGGADNRDDSAVRVLGGLDDVGSVVDGQGRIDEVLISLPTAMRGRVGRLARELDEREIAWRFMPTLADQLAGRIGLWGGIESGLDLNELIGRRARPLDEDAIRQTLSGRCVLVTGAGGSIGSELARLVCGFGPAKLVMVERSENALFEVDRMMGSLYPGVERAAVLHDVADTAGTLRVVREHGPAVVFHAAAHKHVPMMEDHPAAAVENNFFGTKSIADAAVAGGVERFVMISTDKAVNPSSVMGATKRLAELYIQHINGRGGCVFSMVRFGNVLGSACSVLPIWREQLSRGGPITVTDPQMSRYFMTIPEAAGLVLQSATFSGVSGGGEVFLLDMGEPVRVLDLAERFVRSHGLEPGVDVAIEFMGARPGEKLHEELAYDGEDMMPTPHESVRLWRTGRPDAKRMEQIVTTFERLRLKGVSAQGTAGVVKTIGLGGDSDVSSGGDWQGASRASIIAALRVAVPEMVASAAG